MKPGRTLVAMIVVAVALASAGVMGLIHTAQAQAATPTDYDADGDGLIEVGSLAQLDAIRYDLDGDGSPTDSSAYAAAFPNAATSMGCPSSGCTGYELTSNLDFDTNGDGRTDIAGDDYWNGGAGWEPITDSARSGNQDATFHATFEGNSHVISGLYIDRLGRNIGFFGSVWGGEIRNLGLEGVVVKGGASNAGGLVGSTSSSGSHNSLISTSYVKGSIAGATGVGGLVGLNQASINASYVEVSVSGNANIGGLVGTNHSSGSISASYATGSVSGRGNIGGLVGSNQSRGSISASYAMGTVAGTPNAGGLVGSNQSRGSISASYATGSVAGGYQAGGLVGSNRSRGSISASYATGPVSGNIYVGGLVGANETSTPITASYWDTETSGQSTSAGGVGKTTSELQSPTSNTGIYATWDDDVWDFGTSSKYPNLKGVGPVSPVEMDRSTLAALYNATGGTDWTDNTNWLSDEPLGDWHGVTTDDEGRVTRLMLSSNNLVGTIPADLGSLSELNLLELYGNNLSGTIPTELGSLSNLEALGLNINQLSGEIPVELGSLSNLEALGLSNNQLTGPIPAELGRLVNLWSLRLAGNQLTGCAPASLRDVPDNDFDELGLPFCESPCIAGGAVSDAKNTGFISDCHVLLAARNTLAGTATLNWSADRPIAEWEGVTVRGTPQRVTRLTLSEKNLDGTIPRALGRLEMLTDLNLHINALTGPIPAGLGNLSNLVTLNLRNNELTGPIPASLGRLTNLRSLRLQGNELSGTIPAGLGDLEDLVTLALSTNGLSGMIPSSLGRLDKLSVLWLHDNRLTGAIPEELGDLADTLTYLRLRGNSFTDDACLPGNLANVARNDFAEAGLETCTTDSTSDLASIRMIAAGGTDIVLQSVEIVGESNADFEWLQESPECRS